MELFDPAFWLDIDIWVSLLTLTILEIVLGIDNLVFISIVTEKLPANQQPRARKIGLLVAMTMRILLLLMISWIIGLTRPVFEFLDQGWSYRDMVLLGGGLFLLAKATSEIHGHVEGEDLAKAGKPKKTAAFGAVIAQIALLDLVFSLDSVITAVGMVEHPPIMVVAIIIAIAVMLFAADPVSAFVKRHPTVKMLALSFLLLIGTALVADGLHFHIPKGYLYFAVGFAILVEGLNLAARRQRKKASSRA